MLNRRILRIKVFKTLYASKFREDTTLAEAESKLEASCEAARDLYVFMLGIVSPLTAVAREKIEMARQKFNPTEEERNPNMKFADNQLAKELDADPDFRKIFSKRKFSWEQYDIPLKKIMASVVTKDYYRRYMEKPGSSLKDDCRLFIHIFEEEFTDNPDIEKILEDMSIYWNDDLAYSLTYVCRTLENMAKGRRWELPPLYQSDMMTGEGIESDKAFARKLLGAAYTSYDRFSDMIAEVSANWDNDRLVSTDVCIVILGLAEAVTFPTIPVKVTINEYVEISKFYGTPKSGIFVNGLLDRLIHRLAENGEIVKTGRGIDDIRKTNKNQEI